MRSALTAALGNGREAAAAAAAAAPPAAVDRAGFPCLEEEAAADAADAVEALDLGRYSLAGSMRTSALGTADFELHPHSLRGGREVVPASLPDGRVAANFLTQAVIGSLPAGLSAVERGAVLASTPLSPTLHLLSSMPSERFAARSAEGRRLRRHVLRGAVLVFVTAGYSGKRFIYERAKELGCRAVILDGPDSWSRELVKEGVVERFVAVDFSDAETVFERCLAALAKVRRELGELDGVLSFSEMAMPLVARLAEKLGLPGASPAAVDAARDKHATRAAMAAAGLPAVRNFLISDAGQVDAAAAAVGFPAVIKPIYGAASIGVVRVDSIEALRAAHARVARELARARVVAGALEQGGDGDGDGDGRGGGAAAGWIKTTIMMEEYLDGPEVDVDVVLSGGAAVYGAVTDNWPTLEPYFNETGSNAPSTLPALQQRELAELAVRALQALGFAAGVFHVEGKYTSRGPRLIEVNCRMGGGPVRTMNQLVWGVDLVEEALLCAAGIPARPPVARAPLAHVAEYSVNALRSGVLRSTAFLDKYAGDPDVLYARALAAPGDRVVGAPDGLPTWVCELMVRKPSVGEAIAAAQAMEAEIQAAMVIE